MPHAANNDVARHPAAVFIAALFGSTTEQPVFFQTLANDSGDADEAPNKRQLLTREIVPVTRFIRIHDRARRGLFFCVATVAEGSSTRNKETVRETIGLHADIDFKSVVEDEPTIRAMVDNLSCQPTVIVRSGGGLHLYWLFRESADTQIYKEPLEIALKRLAEIVAGDPAVCEVARLMRLPGTHNSKYGDMREVVCERLDGPRYELDELEEWISEQRPVLTRKPIVASNGTEKINTTVADDNPWIAATERWGIKLHLDVDALLAAMGDGNINTSLFRAVGSMTRDGRDVEEIVATLMEASRRVGEPDWDWRKQEKEIRDMCARTQRNFLKEQEVSRETPSDENIVNFDDAKERHGSVKPKPKMRGPNVLLVPFAVADLVIDTLRRHGADILLTEGEVWLYGDGFWRIMTASDQQWLLTEIQNGFETSGEPAKTAALASSWKRLNEHPGLFKASVPWAETGMVVCRNGVLQFETGNFTEHRPDNYARRHIGAEYSAGAVCPQFERLLASMFCDRSDAIQAISLLQEWAGAALAISSLSREERRALILVGPSRTGKTELAKIFSLLFGEPIASPSVAEISEKFGLASLYGAAAWVRDDAINEGDKLDPQRFKTIVTGEPINIQIKNRSDVLHVRLNIPVMITANSLPRARDASDAIFNRSIILTMTNVIDERTATQARIDLTGRSGGSIGATIFETEASGILNWALEGLRRLIERGFYDIPESVAAAIRQFKDDNNPVGEWAREAVEADPWSKVERRDLVRAYNGWELELEGDEARAHGGRWLLPRLRSQIRGLGNNQVHSGARFITGLKLTKVGLAMWESYGKASPRNGAGGFALTSNEVNQVVHFGDNKGAPQIDEKPPF